MIVSVKFTGNGGYASNVHAAASAAANHHSHAAAGMAAAAGASTAVVGDAVNQVTSGIWGLMKDATASLPSATSMFTSTTTTASTTQSTATTTSMYTQQQTTSLDPAQNEVKLPDGQRLAYRMDYVLKETGNTYIAAITSHTAYWCNPDMAYFMLTKIHQDLEKYTVQPVDTRRSTTNLHQPHQAGTQHPHAQQPGAIHAGVAHQLNSHGQYNAHHQQMQQQMYQQHYGPAAAGSGGAVPTSTQQQYNQAYNMQQQHHVSRPQHPQYAHLQGQY